MNILVSQEIASVCPGFVGAAVDARVVNTPYSAELWQEIHALEDRLRQTLSTETLKEQSGIAATRRVYKACGKDPSRYRPASEQLIRRMLQGKELYQIDTLVDLVNLASIAFGYSIGHPHPGHRTRRRTLRGHRARTSEHCRTACVSRRPRWRRHSYQRPRAYEDDA